MTIGSTLQTVLDYHESTKHQLHRLARSLGYLDWSTQPNPFRRYEGAEFVELPLTDPEATPPYDALYDLAETLPVQPVCRESLGAFFQYALAISAWKSYRGTSWALRSNPSSGNLHPTEGYLVIDGVPEVGDQPGVYHYAPEDHGLERRLEFGDSPWRRLMEKFPEGSFLVGLSSIYWREAWKYGERAFRYCQHDLGHAWGSLSVASRILGWRLHLLNDAGDAEVARLLGIDRLDEFPKQEREQPACLAVVMPRDSPVEDERKLPWRLSAEVIAEIAYGDWQGRANRLSPQHVEWSAIDEVSESTVKPATRTTPESCAAVRVEEPILPVNAVIGHPRRASPLPAGRIVRQRRSCLELDGQTRLHRNVILGMLERLLPSEKRFPWQNFPWKPRVHLALFIHRVDGLVPGLYVLARTREAIPRLKAAMRSEFKWTTPRDTPKKFPLYLVHKGNFQRSARLASCYQDIAGDGVFSLGMIAEWPDGLEEAGPWFYRRMFWETGLIGQILYLEAEAAGIRSTGIGCFLDDVVHDILGIRNREFQSLYHFTVGGPVDDPRLQTWPAYPDRES